ncbi:MAG: ribosomal protein S18-alanine N-acetyltransferase [Neptuniibacter sp.]
MAEMIQLLCEKQLPDILRIEHACFQPPWSENQLTQALLNPRYRVFGVFREECSDQELLGFAVFSTLIDEAELLQIGVDPRFQRQGLARSLISHSFEILKQEDTSRVMLEVRESNKSARVLYEVLGFQFDGIRKAYYPPLIQGEPKETAVLMSYEFPE